jgi:hypothetical protein
VETLYRSKVVVGWLELLLRISEVMGSILFSEAGTVHNYPPIDDILSM